MKENKEAETAFWQYGAKNNDQSEEWKYFHKRTLTGHARIRKLIRLQKAQELQNRTHSKP